MENDYAIIVDNITRSYGTNKVVDSLSFKVKKGSIHGFLGPNGAGKTTTMKMIAGVIPPHGGSIKLFSSSVGALLEVPPLFEDMKVEEYLTYLCKINKVEYKSISLYVNEAIEQLKLNEVVDRRVGNLSKGFKQRVGVAGTIVFKPEIVILDEPTVGLDPAAVIEMRECINSISQNHTVLISSHLLHEIDILCDEITIINNGKLIISGKSSEIKEIKNSQKTFYIEAIEASENLETSLKKLEGFIDITSITSRDSIQYELILESNKDRRAEVFNILKESNIEIRSFTSSNMNLEKSFLHLLERGRND